MGVTFTLFAYSIVVNFTSFNFPGKIFTISDHRWTGHHPGIKVLSSNFFPCCHLLHKSFALLNRGLCVNSTSSSHLPVILPLIHQMILGLESTKIHEKFYVPNPLTSIEWHTIGNTVHWPVLLWDVRLHLKQNLQVSSVYCYKRQSWREFCPPPLIKSIPAISFLFILLFMSHSPSRSMCQSTGLPLQLQFTSPQITVKNPDS